MSNTPSQPPLTPGQPTSPPSPTPAHTPPSPNPPGEPPTPDQPATAATPEPSLTASNLLDAALTHPPLRNWLAHPSRPGQTPRTWSEVSPAARAFAVALLLRSLPEPRPTLLILAPNPKDQERLARELPTWAPGGRLFPFLSAAAIEGSLPDPETAAQRLEIIRLLREPTQLLPWLILTPTQLDDPIPLPPPSAQSALHLAPGPLPGNHTLETLTALLESWGYEPLPQVWGRGQFARRGGILDIFSWSHALPLRIEFFGDDIESIREFDPDAQRSIRRLSHARIEPPPDPSQSAPLHKFLLGLPIIHIEPETEPTAATPHDTLLTLQPGPLPSPLPLPDFPESTFAPGDLVLNTTKRQRLQSQLAQWHTLGWHITAVCSHPSETQRLSEILSPQPAQQPSAPTPSTLAAQPPPASPPPIHSIPGSLQESFLCPALQFIVLSDAALFGRSIHTRIRLPSAPENPLFSGRSPDDLARFEPGDYVVHIQHGIARFLGIHPAPGSAIPSLALEFASEARLYIPLEDAWQISRYIGLGKNKPELSDLSSGKWERTKAKASQAAMRYARSLIELQAERSITPGYAFPPDSPWQLEFERAFPFRETPDQLRAIADTKRDMESPRPMDRLICGDVGFGKTEVAIRAAFKAVMGGKQVAFLAPTTVLAQQHYQTLRERMSQFPLHIACLTRFTPPAERRRILQALPARQIDILVGTHGIISPEVQWHDLGLLIVDEEQRFGVRHKELLKQRFRLVDVLTLSATPIPRTLYLALMGARDLSVIETPPPNRQPVETIICPFDERILRDALSREIARGGQAFVLHNRIATIARLAERIRELLPGARVEIGHGQMPEHQLEDVMQRFVEGRTDILVATSIIESGLDIPNANTIIIDRADMFGLADLYQLRGRVGRSGQKAYAYLMLPRSLLTTTDARKRVAAIRQYSELGAGFKIALRDLEIRGAGSLLGTAQSGHIIAVGFDLYCRMLRQAIQQLSSRAAEIQPATLELDFASFSEAEYLASPHPAQTAPAYIPSAYIPCPKARIEAFRKFHEARSEDLLTALQEEWRDRYGPLPPAALNLLTTARIRLAAARRGITHIQTRHSKLMLTRRGDYILFNHKFPRLTSPDPSARLHEILTFIHKFPPSPAKPPQS